MRNSATCNHETTGGLLPFRDAAIAVERAMRKKWGRSAEIPLMSHSLSDLDEAGRWIVRDIGGRDVAIVDSAGRAELVDAVEDE